MIENELFVGKKLTREDIDKIKLRIEQLLEEIRALEYELLSWNLEDL